MSDCDEKVIRNPEVDTDLDNDTTTTKITTTRTPGAALRALLTHVLTTSTPSPSSSTSISFTKPPSPPPPPPLFRSSVQSNELPRTASEIIPRLFISDIFTALNAPTLRSLHITHIISVIEYAVTLPSLSQPCAESELRVLPHPPPEMTSLSLKTLHVRLADLPATDIFSYFATTRDFITTALKDENARVLVHCYKGQSRSPTIVAAYLISTLRISTSDSLKMIQAKRPMALPNRGFRRQLEQWEVMVREEEDIICSDK